MFENERKNEPEITKPVTEKTPIEEILTMVDDLDEDSSKFIYEQLQLILVEIDNDLKQKELDELKEKLLTLQIEQTELIPSLPKELTASLPPEFAEKLTKDMKEAYLHMADQNINQEVEVKEMSPDIEKEEPITIEKDIIPQIQHSVNDELSELEEENRELQSFIPEEVMKNLPQEVRDVLKQQVMSARKDIIEKEISRARDTKAEEEKEEYLVEDVDVSLPPTPAVDAPWSVVAEQLARPSGPTPADSENFERKMSGPFDEPTKSTRRELFTKEEELINDPEPNKGVSSDITIAAKTIVNNVINEAKEKVISMSSGDNIVYENQTTLTKLKESDINKPTSDDDAKESEQEVDLVKPDLLEIASKTVAEVIINAKLKLAEMEDNKVIQDGKERGSKNSTKESDLISEKIKNKSLQSAQLCVVVHQARNIEKKGLLGKADPYVQIKLGNETRKSETVDNDHNPVWNFETKFNFSEESPEEIRFEVFDEDIGKDDTLGETIISLEEIPSKQIVNKWIPLEKCKSGELCLSIKMLPFDQDEIHQPKKPPLLHDKSATQEISNDDETSFPSETSASDKEEDSAIMLSPEAEQYNSSRLPETRNKDHSDLKMENDNIESQNITSKTTKKESSQEENIVKEIPEQPIVQVKETEEVIVGSRTAESDKTTSQASPIVSKDLDEIKKETIKKSSVDIIASDAKETNEDEQRGAKNLRQVLSKIKENISDKENKLVESQTDLASVVNERKEDNTDKPEASVHKKEVSQQFLPMHKNR